MPFEIWFAQLVAKTDEAKMEKPDEDMAMIAYMDQMSVEAAFAEYQEGNQ